MQYQDLPLTSAQLQEALDYLKMPLSEPLYQDLLLMQQATNLGSLIQPQSSSSSLQAVLEAVHTALPNADMFVRPALEHLAQALPQLIALSQRYHCVVDNPPYMGGGKMNKALGDFVKKNYPAGKGDLMVCFMQRAIAQLHPGGFVGMINLPSWMFISSFEAYRKKMLQQTLIDTLLHLGRGIFGSDFGSVAFTFINQKSNGKQGVYRRLFEKHVQVRSVDKIEALFLDKSYGHYQTYQQSFDKIPGKPIGYWVSEKVLSIFAHNKKIADLAETKSGLSTTDNEQFLRRWSEVFFSDANLSSSNKEEAINSQKKWFPYSKGGPCRKWYGNNEFFVNWKNDGQDVRDCIASDPKKQVGGRIVNENHYFRRGVGWSDLTSGQVSARLQQTGNIFDSVNPVAFLFNEDEEKFLLGLLNTKFINSLSKLINPTLHFTPGNARSLPIPSKKGDSINFIVEDTLKISQYDWDSRETSWDFQQNELIRVQGQDLLEAWELYQLYWRNKFVQLHKNEEALNREFIDLYGLQDELTPDVPLKDITILQQELDRKALEAQDATLPRDPDTGLVSSYESLRLKFDAKEVVKQLISYAVGCMFGRYSLDQPGLVLANQGQTLDDYLQIVEKSADEVRFLPDDDNVIPVLDDEWFEDDIVGRFYAFLKAAFGTADFDKNLAFVKECLGSEVRRYFVKEFYTDHVRRYKKRPIYWMIASPKGAFSALVYLHRYTPDTLHHVLNGYLKEYHEKLRTRLEQLDHLIESGTSAEQTRAAKEKDRLKGVLLELQEYERDVLYPLATDRIALDLDDGVLVNYNKLGQAVKEEKGLNDAKTKAKVKKFDWIDSEEII
ncbi:MAG TPA: BREX-1 system adenine-specific DNA-methyltransferase PglX [Microscillaceae bacterium]|nr:BREX-1 system adenine-specific DNA-methyltransferase PglX [Microscillaceae bacterium]